jgi:hypothetical protein
MPPPLPELSDHIGEPAVGLDVDVDVDYRSGTEEDTSLVNSPAASSSAGSIPGIVPAPRPSSSSWVVASNIVAAYAHKGGPLAQGPYFDDDHGTDMKEEHKSYSLALGKRKRGDGGEEAVENNLDRAKAKAVNHQNSDTEDEKEEFSEEADGEVMYDEQTEGDGSIPQIVSDLPIAQRSSSFYQPSTELEEDAKVLKETHPATGAGNSNRPKPNKPWTNQVKMTDGILEVRSFPTLSLGPLLPR